MSSFVACNTMMRLRSGYRKSVSIIQTVKSLRRINTITNKVQEKHFTIVKDETMKLPNQHSSLSTKETSFNFIDCLQPNTFVNMGFYYESTEVPDDFDEKLKSALQKLIEERYPELTGSINHENDYLVLKHSNIGYRFVQAESNSEHLDFNNLPHEFYPGSQISLNRAILHSDPVFMVQVTRTPKGVILAMSSHHLLGDVYAMLLFYEELALAYNGVPIRGNAKPERTLLPVCKVKNFYCAYSTEQPWADKRFIVKKDSLERVKANYMGEIGDKADIKFLSSNDILVAIFWKASMKAKGIFKSSAATVAECRQQLDLPKDFFSNAVYLNCIYDIDIANTSYAEIAALNRKNVNKSTNKEVLQSFVDQGKETEFVDEIHVANRMNYFHEDLLITSFSKYSGAMGFSFGFGDVTNFSIHSFGNFNVLGIIQFNPEEFVVGIKLKEEEMERLEEDPEIQKLLSS